MDTIPSTADPTLTALIYTIIMKILAALGVFGITWGSAVSGQGWQVIAGTIAWFVTLGLALYREWQLKAHAHASAVASAKAGKPLQPAP